MSGPAGFPSPGPGPITIVHHHICQHQVEIEIWPPVAEAYFRDARYVDPINTQVRFQATVLNAENAAVSFQVRSLSGGAGLGTIDERKRREEGQRSENKQQCRNLKEPKEQSMKYSEKTEEG